MLSSLYLIAFNLYMSLKEKKLQYSRQNCLLRHSLTGVVSSKQLISEERHLQRSSLKLFDTFKTFLYVALGGTKNTNFQNSMGALSNPISFAPRISELFLFLF